MHRKRVNVPLHARTQVSLLYTKSTFNASIVNYPSVFYTEPMKKSFTDEDAAGRTSEGDRRMMVIAAHKMGYRTNFNAQGEPLRH